MSPNLQRGLSALAELMCEDRTQNYDPEIDEESQPSEHVSGAWNGRGGKRYGAAAERGEVAERAESATH